jgi:Uma2 family endonuclease
MAPRCSSRAGGGDSRWGAVPQSPPRSHLAGWRRERLPRALGGADAPAHDDLASDWACELLSERTRSRDKGQKMRIYAREGVRPLWHVDPLARTLEVFRLVEGQWQLVPALGPGG